MSTSSAFVAPSTVGLSIETVDRRVSERMSAFFMTLLALTLLYVFAATESFAQTSATITKHTSQTPTAVLDGRATLVDHYGSQQMLRVAFALLPRHVDEEQQLLDQLHDKKSPMFHQFLTAEEWNARFAPSAQDEQAVVDWATSQGLTVSHRYPNRLLVDVEAPAAAIEKALNVKLNHYKMGEATYFSNDRDPSLPAAINGSVQAVLGLNSFTQLKPAHTGSRVTPRPDYVAGPAVLEDSEHHVSGSPEKMPASLKPAKAHAQGLGSPQITNGSYDPTDLYSSQAYDTNALNAQGHCCNPYHNSSGPPVEASIAIAAFGDLDYNDVYAFHNQYPYLAENFQKIYINGAYTCNNSPNIDDNCLEVTLDTQWSLAMANSYGSYLDTAKVWIYEGSTYSYATIAAVYNTMLSDGHARVFSTSWAAPESGYADSEKAAADSIFAAMVAQGWTLTAASGDQGSSGGCGDLEQVLFPASDPNIVAAGGTLLSLYSDSSYASEVGWTGGNYSGACAHNNGGSTGGFSSYFGTPSFQTRLGFGSRAVPDIALNASAGQNMYYAAAGGLIGVGGTSIVAPELAGFFAQENAYLLSIGNACGSGTRACAPMGNANYYIYDAGYFGGPHYPFYDITSGCNTNDVTNYYGLGYYCAGVGFDEVTGWGSANMLQLAWAMNWYNATGNGSPSVAFSGPATNTWYNSDQTISWSVTDHSGSSGVANVGLAGFTQGWDSIPGDVYREATPGSGNSFYSGPQFPNAVDGCLELAGGGSCQGGVSQGCHTAHVQAWNNMGQASGDVTYGPICYDTIAPTTTASLSGTKNGSIFISAVHIALSASDTGSGVAATYIRLDGGSWSFYSGPVTVSTTGPHSVQYVSIDKANNEGPILTTNFSIESATTSTIASSVNPVYYGKPVVLTAHVAGSFGGTPTGIVSFLDGATVIGNSTLSGGTASLSLSALNSGSHSLSAKYNGSGYDEASSSTVIIEKVNAATSATTVASSRNPSLYGASLTFTAVVHPAFSGTPTGTVKFENGATVLATIALASGKAVFTTSSLAVGNATIKAVYSGSTDFTGSTSTALTETIQKAATSTTLVSSLNPSIFGKLVSFTAKVASSTTGVPTGTVTFQNGSVTLGTVSLSSGKAVFNTSSLPVGGHLITAVYNGSVDDAASTSAKLAQTVDKEATSTTVTSSLNPSIHGHAVTFTVKVVSPTGTPTGTVRLADGVSTITLTLTAGKAVYTTSTLPVGNLSVHATYDGATDFASSNSPVLIQKVTP